MGVNNGRFMGFQKLDTQLSEINVTPFVDVMLVLLVIFMVTAPLMQHGVDVELPQANAGTVKYSEDNLMVTIDKKGSIRLEDQNVSLFELEKKLSALHKNKKNLEVYLSADRNVRYGIVVQATAAIKNAGITRLGMVTEPDYEIKTKK
jgi:biopolymer transport protein TolR